MGFETLNKFETGNSNVEKTKTIMSGVLDESAKNISEAFNKFNQNI